MQTFSYYSRNLLIEQIQKAVFTNIMKTINWYYYIYFKLSFENRLLVQINSKNLYTECYIKYEDRNSKDIMIFKWILKNIIHINNLSNIVDRKIEILNSKNNILINYNNFDFWDYNDDFDLIE